MANNDVILSARDVEIQFSLRGRKLTAIRKCSLDLHKGETLAIVGESGSGKSVFTKSFLGMLDANGKIIGGSIMYDGVDISKYTTEKEWMTIRGKKIAMVMHDPMTSLNPLKKIGKQIQESIEINQGIKAVQESLDPSHGIIDFAFIYALSPTYIPQTIQQFLKNPATKNYSFRFYQGNSRKILPGIQDGSYDLGICSYLDIEPELDFTPIIRQEYVLIVGNHHPLASKNRVTLEEAARYDFIMPLDQTSFVEKLFQLHHLSPHITSRVEEDHAAASLVSINLGLAILPRNPMLDQYGIRQISFAPEPVYRDFYLVRRKNGGMTPAAEKFYRYLKESGQVIFRNTENS